ncbi:FtsB family cell division protein [Thiomicrorhabdus cannonii]|uniref:FtsB family cell division protein n=1 Tax=Thiomicrorhabdus cannonii TaxID=2748011 RepID=UPI0015BD2EFF|nr:septum formation initiator family protein [Thiomicrorhabdus cannonii]
MKKIALILSLIIVVLLARLLSSHGGLGELFSLQNQLSELETQLQQQERENAELSQQVQDLQSQNSAIETIARQTLGMIGQDEVFVEVIELKNPVAPSITSATTPSTSSEATSETD